MDRFPRNDRHGTMKAKNNMIEIVSDGFYDSPHSHIPATKKYISFSQKEMGPHQEQIYRGLKGPIKFNRGL